MAVTRTPEAPATLHINGSTDAPPVLRLMRPMWHVWQAENQRIEREEIGPLLDRYKLVEVSHLYRGSDTNRGEYDHFCYHFVRRDLV